MTDATHEGNDPMGAPTLHRGLLDNCPAPDCQDRILEQQNDERVTVRAAELKADWSRYRGTVLQEVWEALRDAEDGPLIDGMKVVNGLLEKATDAERTRP